MSSKLFGLCPRLDEDGVIRLNTRLQYAEFLPYDVRHPIVLLQKNWVTKLIVKYFHEKVQEQTKHCLCYQLNIRL